MAAIEERKKEALALAKALQTISEKQLKGEDLVTFQLLKFRVAEEIENQKFPGHLLAINQMEGIQSELVDVFFFAPKRTAKDLTDMLSRLEKAPAVLKQVEVLLREGVKAGVTPPKVTLAGLPAQLDRLLPAKIDASPILANFIDLKADVPDALKAEVRQKAKETLSQKVIPALRAFRDYVANEYIPHCREEVGWSALPNGKAWYNALIKHHTTTDLTSDEIHELGLKEVARLRGEMEKVRAQIKFKGNLARLNDFIRTDKQFYFTNTTDLLNGYRVIAKQLDAELPRFFGRLPRMPYGVREMPAFKAPNSPAAYYESGSFENGRPAYFNANTYDLKARPKWGMIDLTCHEAVPGHHLQIGVAQELEGLPVFRRKMDYTAYVEGWALYAESLCDDMGMYSDPYAKYGQLTGEMWRAVRLVVDTGLHAKGWSRDQVVKYFRENGAFSDQEIDAETNRYIVWAGQALAYKIGELKIKELRQNARSLLGENFDVRTFHDAVLGSGSLPMKVLEAKMSAWAKLKASAAAPIKR